MSGARIPADWSSVGAPRSSRPAWGSAFCEPSTVLLGWALKPRPAAIAKRARKARAATIQGSAFVLDSREVAVAEPTAVPQRWQNLAPGITSAEQEAKLATGRRERQFAQG